MDNVITVDIYLLATSSESSESPDIEKYGHRLRVVSLVTERDGQIILFYLLHV